jgi:hypothetical protein
VAKSDPAYLALAELAGPKIHYLDVGGWLLDWRKGRAVTSTTFQHSFYIWSLAPTGIEIGS